MSENNSRKITILYGSQTGNAQDVSERIWRESKRFHFTSSVKSMDDYNITNLINEKCVIFVCSTTGQGDEPDNMKSFWKFLLRKNLPSNSLTNLKCAVLGLGDSSYVKYNFAAKRLNKRLLQLGAQMVLPLTLGDDQHDLGYDAVVDTWINSLWKEILTIYPLPSNVQPLDKNSIIQFRWNIKTLNNRQLINDFQKSSIYFSDTVKVPDDQFWVELKDNIKTTSPTHFQDVRLITFLTEGQEYAPGDIVNIRPKNSNEQIYEFYDILRSNGVNIAPQTIFKLSDIDSEMHVPSFLQDEISFQTLCEEYFDLTSIPRRYVFSVLAQITSNELEKEKCIEFTIADGQNDLYNYCNRPKRNITEVLRDFPHAVKNLTIEMMFEIFPPIKSRAFSIASSSKAHKNQIQILVAVVKYKTKLVKERLGLCSNWLANLKIGTKIPVWIKKGSFKFPKEEDTPVIMVGPGTGVAPFRSYISEMEYLCKASSKILILFFGCRQEQNDFHCKDEFKRLEKENKLDLICAFSRDQEHKIYVQHKIEEYGECIWNLMNRHNQASIYVAGNSKNMPQSVREAFVYISKKFGNISAEEAENYITRMERNGRYQTETWS